MRTSSKFEIVLPRTPREAAPATTNETHALKPGTIARYAAGSLATGGFSTLPGLVLVYYLTDSLGVSALAAGATITIAKVWDVLIAPIMGGLSDRARKERGTRRGLMLIGAVGLPLTFLLTFSVPAGMSPLASGLWVFFAFTAAATFFSAFQVPYIALPAELTPSYTQRTRLLSWRVVILSLGILLFGAGGPEIRALFPERPLVGYFAMGMVSAAMLAIGLLLGSTVAPRDTSTAKGSLKLPKRLPRISFRDYRAGFTVIRQSQPFRALLATFVLQALVTGLMLAGAQYVATWILHDENAVSILFASLIAPAIIFSPLWKKLADRIGKERAFQIASIVFLLATLILGAVIWIPGWWIVAPVGLAGAAYAGMQTLPMAMLPDVINHHEASVATQSEGQTTPSAGIFGGMWTAGETGGMALGSTVLTIVLMITGYIQSSAGVSASQPDSAITGIALAFSLLPSLLMSLSLITLKHYRLTKADIEGSQ